MLRDLRLQKGIAIRQRRVLVAQKDVMAIERLVPCLQVEAV